MLRACSLRLSRVCVRVYALSRERMMRGCERHQAKTRPVSVATSQQTVSKGGDIRIGECPHAIYVYYIVCATLATLVLCAQMLYTFIQFRSGDTV